MGIIDSSIYQNILGIISNKLVPSLSSDVGVNKFENIKIEVPAWNKHEVFMEGSHAEQFDYFGGE